MGLHCQIWLTYSKSNGRLCGAVFCSFVFMNRYFLWKVTLHILLYGITISFVFLFLTQQKVATHDFSWFRLLALLLFLPVLFKYLVQLFVAPWFELCRWRKGKTLRLYQKYAPKVSVLIPAWNEEVGILHTVLSVLKSTYRNMEIVVINDGSTDGTHRKMTEFLQKYRSLPKEGQLPIIYKHKENGGKASAFNCGLKRASGDIIITIDSDSAVDSRAIENMVKPFRDEAVMSVAGNVKIGNRSKVIGLVQQLEYLYGFYFKKADSLMNSVYIVGGAAAAYRRTVFAKLGVFDEEIITEDIEMSTRIQDAGMKIEYAPDAVVYTEGPADFQGLARQRLRWKYGRLLTFSKYRQLFFSLRRKHSPLLTWFILPFAAFSESVLFFEPALILIFYSYMFATHDFFPLIAGAVVISLVVFLQVLTDTKRRENLNLLLLAPVAWCLFYFVDFVEYQALLRSIWKLIKKQQVVWQKWTREGVFE